MTSSSRKSALSHRRAAILPALGAAVSFAAMAADVFVGVPPLNPDPGTQVSIQLFVDVGTDVLGSYFFRFQYSPSVVNVVSIQGGSSPEFSGAPTTDPNGFAGGSTPLAAAQGSITSPTGLVSVATIRLQAVGLPADSSNLDLMVNSLFNAKFDPLPATVFPSSVLINVPEVGADLALLKDGQTLTWSATSNIAAYNVYRGTFGGAGFAFNHACLIPNLATPGATDSGIPPAGKGFYYLISGERNSVEGTLGRGSAGQPRPIISSCNVGSLWLVVTSGDVVGADISLQAEAPSSQLPNRPARTVSVDATDARGDLTDDGFLDDQDVHQILEAVVGTRLLTPSQRARADVDGDGKLTVADAQHVQQVVAGSVGELPRPAATGAGGPPRGWGSLRRGTVGLGSGFPVVKLRCGPSQQEVSGTPAGVGPGFGLSSFLTREPAKQWRYPALCDGVPTVGVQVPIGSARVYRIPIQAHSRGMDSPR